MSVYQSMSLFREKLRANRLCLGIGITLSDPAVTEALGAHADFYWIDLEHTALGLESLQAHLIAARAVGVPALVRVPASEGWFLKRVLDLGAPGVIVPQVRSADEVKRVIQACRYHPAGDRGYGPRRASAYGADRDYLQSANQQVFVAVQIEHTEALRELDRISECAGLDSLVLGPFDLALSMGHRGEVTHPAVAAAMQTVIQTAQSRGLFVGMGGPAQEDYVTRAAQAGVQWIQCGSDFEYMGQFIEGFFSRVNAKLPARRPV